MIGSLHFYFSLIFRRLLHDRQPAFLFQLEEIASQATLFVSNLSNQILLFSLVIYSVLGLINSVLWIILFCVFGLIYSVLWIN